MLKFLNTLTNEYNNLSNPFDATGFHTSTEMKENGHYKQLIDQFMQPFTESNQLSFIDILNFSNNLTNNKSLLELAKYEKIESNILEVNERAKKLQDIIDDLFKYFKNAIEDSTSQNYNIGYNVSKAYKTVHLSPSELTNSNKVVRLGMNTDKHLKLSVPYYKINLMLKDINIDASCSDPYKRFIVPMQYDLEFLLTVVWPISPINEYLYSCHMGLYFIDLLINRPYILDDISNIDDLLEYMIQDGLSFNIQYTNQRNLNSRFVYDDSAIGGGYHHPFISGDSLCFDNYEQEMRDNCNSLNINNVIKTLSEWSMVYTNQSSPHQDIHYFLIGSPKNYENIRSDQFTPPVLSKVNRAKCYNYIKDHSICTLTKCVFKNRCHKEAITRKHLLENTLKKWDQSSPLYTIDDGDLLFRLDIYLVNQYLIQTHGTSAAIYNKQNQEIWDTLEVERPTATNYLTTLLHLPINKVVELIDYFGGDTRYNIPSPQELRKTEKDSMTDVSSDLDLYRVSYANADHTL